MKRRTEDLLAALRQSKNIDDFVKENEDEFINTTLSQHLNELLSQKGMKKSDVIKSACLNDIYAYQIFQGVRAPSRDKVICIAFGFGLDLVETQNLLKFARINELYARSKRDTIIIFAIEEKLDIHTTNELLYELNEYTLT